MEFFTEQFRKRHFLIEVDPRVKIVASVFTLLLVISYEGFLFPLIIIAGCTLLCLKMKVPFKVFIIRYSEPAFIAIVLILLKLFLSGSEVLFTLDMNIFTLTGYQDGLLNGLMLASRIMAAVSVIIVLGFSTPFTAIMAGLSWFKVPKTLIEITMFAYRYIFVLLEDAMVIYNAQKNRLGYSSITRGINSFSTLTGSLILKAFEHSQKTTIAMVQRGYDGNIPFIKHKPFKHLEIAISVLFMITLGALWRI
ncbi:MAG: cobalt ECF transporter T component CbiQ [Thermodesulfovibrionales bacterium]|nr:cobalt ECF transporter T component CbiQ [Thermodesulfovibrionales bacterium]